MLRDHCAHARYVWNLAVEQHQHWRPGRKSAPGYLEQSRQLTQARAEHPWLAAGSQMAQQALRDFAQAVAAFFDPGNPTGRPSWRKAGRDEGFRLVGRRGRQWDVRRLSRHVGQVWVPRAGWVRFRWSRQVPLGAKHVDAKPRESQARFPCTACGFADHADVNAARNIAAGHPTHLPIPLHWRGGFRVAGPANREPQLLAS